jgi:hypothetical protein
MTKAKALKVIKTGVHAFLGWTIAAFSGMINCHFATINETVNACIILFSIEN